MKYLLIFLLSFSLVSPVFAAAAVKGSVPKVQPLQPTPAGTAPNLSNNIELRDATRGEFNASGSPAGTQAQNPQAAQGVVANPRVAPLLVQASGHPWGWSLVILILLLLGWFWYKQNKGK